jgi:hypothetical protein
MFSARFNKPIIITRHAQLRMVQRAISTEELMVVMDTGDVRQKDAAHLWVFKTLPHRTDNMICAVLVLEDSVIVKTVMHEFLPEA